MIKVVESLENRGNLLKGTTKEITSQEGGFPNFLKPLMTACLLSIRNVLTPLATSALIRPELIAAASAINAAIQKKIYGLGTMALIDSDDEWKI